MFIRPALFSMLALPVLAACQHPVAAGSNTPEVKPQTEINRDLIVKGPNAKALDRASTSCAFEVPGSYSYGLARLGGGAALTFSELTGEGAAQQAAYISCIRSKV